MELDAPPACTLLSFHSFNCSSSWLLVRVTPHRNAALDVFEAVVSLSSIMRAQSTVIGNKFLIEHIALSALFPTHDGLAAIAMFETPCDRAPEPLQIR